MESSRFGVGKGLILLGKGASLTVEMGEFVLEKGIFGDGKVKILL